MYLAAPIETWIKTGVFFSWAAFKIARVHSKLFVLKAPTA